ncbi:MAG: hypothetical protein IPM95_08820 [Sphingobacteriales bacterium]|nr:hypothetical protein [Sphingobacteriales bacterium]
MRKIISGIAKITAGILLMCAGSTQIFAQVNVTSIVTPPFSSDIDDYANVAKANVMMMSTTNTYMIYPQVVITGNNGITIKSINNAFLYTSSTLVPFTPTTLSSLQLSQLFDRNKLTVSGMDRDQLAAFMANGTIPAGTYSMCFEAWSGTAASVKVSNPAPNGCATMVVGNPAGFNRSLNESPRTILPLCNSDVLLTVPQNVVFTWMDPSSANQLNVNNDFPGLQEYVLKIIEVVGKKSANEAMRSATTPPFFEKTIFGTSYVYGPAEPPFKLNTKYAYTISVKNNPKQYQNFGVSDACMFTCVSPVTVPPTAESPGKSTIPKNPKISTNITFDETKIFQPIPVNTIKGRLIYAFKKTEESKEPEALAFSPVSSGSTKVNDFNAVSNVNAFLQAYGNSSSASSENKPLDANVNYVNTSPSLGNMSVSSSPGLFQNFDLTSEQSKSIYQKVTEKIASNAGVHKFPLANTKVKVSLWIKQEIMEAYVKNKGMKIPDINGSSGSGIKLPPNDIYIGTATTDKDGNFSVSFTIPDIEMSFYDVEVWIDNPQFDFPVIPIPFNDDKTGTYDVGTVLGLANTYRLTLKAIGMEGKPLEKAEMQVRRSQDIYSPKPYLNPEGNRFLDVINGKVPEDKPSENTEEESASSAYPAYQGLNFYLLIDNSVPVSSCSTGKCTFPRLFESNGNDEKYELVIKAEGYKPFHTTLEFWPYHTLNFGGASLSSYVKDNGIMQLDATYFLIPEPPKVVGRIVAKENEIPLKDALITLTSKDGKDVYTAVSKEDGKFSITNIKKSNEPYQLVVKGDGITTYKDPEPVFLTSDGITIKKDPIYVHAQMIPVAGVVAEVKGPVINGAELRWKSGGNAFYTNEQGQFITSNRAGKYVLVVKKPGFRDKEIAVEIKAPSKNNKMVIDPKNTPDYSKMTGQLMDIFNKTTSSKSNPVVQPANQQALMHSFGYAAPAGTSEKSDVVTHQNFIMGNFGYALPAFPIDIINTIQLDTIFLSRFYVKVTVKDNDNNEPIKDASVEVPDTDGKFTTDVNGVAIVSNVPQGAPTIWVYGPKDKNYIAVSTEVTVSGNKDTSESTVMLKGGAVVSGTVTSKGSVVKDAEIYVDGKPYIKTSSDASGNYSFSVPVGEYTLKAKKSGMVGTSTSKTFEKQNYTIDFELKDPGFNASKLLGFEIALDNSEPTSNPDEFVISGTFQNIPSNLFFKFPASKKLEFKNITILKQGDIIVPKSEEVVTSCSQIPLQLWDYVKLVLENPAGIVVKSFGGDKTKGVIGGELKVDVAGSFGMSYGLKWPAVPLKLLNNKLSDVPVFTSMTSPLDAAKFSLSGPSDGWDIYGVKLAVDFTNTTIDNKGISFAGSLSLKDIPGLSSATLKLEELRINTNGNIQKCAISVTPNPEISLLGWKLKINAAKINQYGLTFGGGIEIPVPGSEIAKFDFANLGISASSFTGGSFFIPSAGVNIFNVINFKGVDGVPFSFSKIPSKDAYRITGGGSIGFPKYISKKVEIDNFVIATNGEFGLTVKPNFEVGFADVANLKISALGLYPSQKKIDVGGSFKLFLPGMGFGAGASIHYKPGSFTVDDLSFSASAGPIGSIKLDKFSFKENGFEGGGGLEIAGFGGLGMYLKYYKLSGGMNIAADFTNPVPIPLGPVTWENPGGGFEVNTATSVYDVHLTGRVVLAPGTSGVVALDKLKVGVTVQVKGPVFYGEGYPKVISMTVGKAEFQLNVPDKLFYVKANVGANFNLIPNLGISGNAGFTLSASAKSGNEYWLAAYYNNVNVLGLFTGYTNIAGGWGPKKSEFPAELSFVPDEYVSGGRIYGLHFACSSFQGITKENAKCANDPVVGIAKVCGYAYNDMNLHFHSNLKSGTYGMGIKNGWGSGGSIYFFDVGVGGFNFGVDYGLNAGYSGGNWFINGNANADFNGWVGCSSSSCGNGLNWGCCFDPCFWDSCEICPCPCGGKVCFGVGVSVDYSTATGKFKLGLDW